MSMLLHRHGDRVLRLKGLLNVAGVPGPVLVNGVQHLVHPPAHLDRWPNDDRASRLVVISSGLDRAEIERSLQVFNALANPRPARNTRQDTTCDRAAWASTRTGCAPAPDAGSIRYG